MLVLDTAVMLIEVEVADIERDEGGKQIGNLV